MTDLNHMAAAAIYGADVVARHKQKRVSWAPSTPENDPECHPSEEPKTASSLEVLPFDQLPKEAQAPYRFIVGKLARVLKPNKANLDNLAFNLHNAIKEKYGTCVINTRVSVEIYFQLRYAN